MKQMRGVRRKEKFNSDGQRMSKKCKKELGPRRIEIPKQLKWTACGKRELLKECWVSPWTVGETGDRGETGESSVRGKKSNLVRFANANGREVGG